jgi:glycerate kinase
MKVLIVPDKFKGTLSAMEAAQAIATGWSAIKPSDEIALLPMTDGGDGFGEILGRLFQAERQTAQTVDAAHNAIEAEWWWSETRGVAIVESAKIIGLAMLPAGKFHPFELDTRGLGQLLRQIASTHPHANLLIGIGGSATNDAGFGLALGLGYRFSDGTGHCLDRWLELDRVLEIDVPPEVPRFSGVTIASDVQNPLLGPGGASRIYGPQKGLRPEDFSIADRCFERFTEVIQRDFGRDCAAEPGTGAAGGLGYGLRVFLGGEFKPGFDIFAEAANLRNRIRASDLVITGEGSIDRQTQMGKGTGAVANLARSEGKRCVALAGIVSPELEPGTFDLAMGIVPGIATRKEAIREPARWLSRLAAEAARQLMRE